MKKTPLAVRIISAILALSILFAAGCGKTVEEPQKTTEPKETAAQVHFDKKAENFEKNETVFVNLTADGSVKNVTVTDWLHTEEPNVFINDSSSLSGITNIKSSVLPVINGKSLIWHMNTTDLYYSGKSTKPLPVEFKIKYFIDDKELSAEKAAGKSGKLRMEIEIKNNDSKEIKINGKMVKIYNPLVAIGGLMLQGETFKNVVLNSGKSVNDASKQIAMMFGLPGINESLNLAELGEAFEGMSFPESFILEADVTNLEIGNMFFAVIPLASLDLGLALPGSVADIEDGLSLISGLQDVFEKLNKNGALETLLSSPKNLSTLMLAAKDAIELYKSNRALLNVLTKHLTKENFEVLTTLLKHFEGDELKEMLNLLSNPALQLFFKDLPVLLEDISAAQPLLESLAADLEKPEVKKALNNLPQTIKAIEEMKATFEKNEELLSSLNTLFSNDNMNELTKMLDSLNEMLSNKTVSSKYSQLAGGAGELIKRMTAWLEMGNEYKIYTEAPKNAKSSVMFVFETEGISAD